MGDPIIIVSNGTVADRLARFVLSNTPAADLTVLTGRDGVVDALEAKVTPDTMLVCFSTGVIIPKAILARINGPAYNFHAASPEYPGRDPHHFAVYDRAKRYGATAHELIAPVDSGRIVGVEWFDVAPGTSPNKLRAAAVEAMFKLSHLLIPKIIRREILPDAGVEWSGRMRTRKEFLEMCQIDPSISREEFERRYFAFDGGDYENLTTVIHGYRFRIDKRNRQ